MSAHRIVALIWLLNVALLPSANAAAQSATGGTIAGAVKDTTGAVLPGVTVEASSPALIEKVRTVVTDGQGQYKIVELRPGQYTVTFTLPGFASVKREGIELTTGFTAGADAVMRVGSLEETVTVSGASPIVDVQNVRTQKVFSQEVLDTLPTAKGLPGLAALTLGAVGNLRDVGGNQGEAPTAFAVHGGRSFDQKIKFDGMPMNSFYAAGGGAARNFLLNQVSIAEMVIETGGISAESETGGVQTNAVPRDGGNAFKVYGLANYTNGDLQSKNVTPELQAAGVTTPPSVKKIYDSGIGVGGPVKRDRLWFYGANRWWGAQQVIPGAYWNATHRTLFYTPDLSRPAFDDNHLKDHGVRLTLQAGKHKLAFSENAQQSCVCSALQSANTAPEATTAYRYGGSDGENNGFHHLVQTTWTNPATHKLLFEAGTSFLFNRQANVPVEGVTKDDISITDVAVPITYNAMGGSLFGAVYSIDPSGKQVTNVSDNFNQRASVAYVTGSHAFKAGFQSIFGNHNVHRWLNPLQYSFRSGVPISLTQLSSPAVLRTRIRTAGVYLQDQWTAKRLTLNLGIRFDRFNARNLAQHLPPARFVPARDWPEVENVPNWKDVTPRLGAAYNLFGNGKTAVKGSIGRYMIGAGVSIPQASHLAQQEVNSITRTWNDSFYPVGDSRRGNYVPDCDLTSVAANAECGAMSNSLFGTTVINTVWDPDVLNGWGKRDYSWASNVSVQHELRPGLGLNAGYYRTWYGNFRVTDNLAIGPADFDPYCVTVPMDSRLPNAGQQLCGLYDIKGAAFGRVNNLVTDVSHYGKQTETYNGFEISLNGTFAGGGRLSGGISSGQTVFDNCAVIDSPQIFCKNSLPWTGQTQIKINGSYPLPGDLQVSGVLQNLPGIPITASYVASNGEIAPTLGRNLGQCRDAAVCNGTVTLANLFEPNTEFADRLSQLDLRFSKVVHVGRQRIQGLFDIYNVFNANTVLSINNRLTPGAANAWLRPTAILAARLFKFGVQYDF